MRVAFVSGNREKLPDAAIPLGMLYLIAGTPRHHSTTLVDLCFEDDPFEMLERRLCEFEPEIVALGMRNIQRADYSGTSHTIDYYNDLLKVIRGARDCPVVMGGSGFSVKPIEIMERLRPDYGIAGEAEEAFPALLAALETGEGLDRIGNLHWFEDGRLTSNPAPSGFLEIDAVRPPDRSLVDRRYYEQFGIESLQTKRGCPLKCDYCTYPLIEGRVGRLRNPTAVVDELESLIEQHPETNHVFIVDSVFNLPRTHAKSVCREMISRGTKMPWTCYANPLGFDEELAALMARSGCAGIEVGADSGSNEVLVRLRKGFNTDQIQNLHDLAEASGIPDCHTFILGTPGESLDDVVRTLDFIVALDPVSAILMVWVDDGEALDVEHANRQMALREKTLRLLEEHKAEFPWWSIPPLGVNYDPRLFELLRRRGFHGPLWQHIRGLIGPAEGGRERQVAPAAVEPRRES